MNLEEIQDIENELIFHSFTHQDAWCIANMILERVKKEKLRRIGIRVVLNGVLIFQYLMDGKEEDMWLKRKQHTVETFQHSSYYLYIDNQLSQSYQQYQEDQRYAICGGGFPINIQGNIKGVFCVSGLAHDQDHQLIVEAFRTYLYQKSKEEHQ